MRLVEKIPLPNGLVAEIWDQSRAIAADTRQVILLVRITVTLKPEYFPDLEQFRITQDAFGKEVRYELKKERTFVVDSEARHVFNVFFDEFKRDALPYLSKKQFPAGLARSKYMEIRKNPYRHGQTVGR